MLYDAWLSRGGAEGSEPLDTPTEFKEGDEFVLGLEVYKVTGIKPGHDEYDAGPTAELIGAHLGLTACARLRASSGPPTDQVPLPLMSACGFSSA